MPKPFGKAKYFDLVILTNSPDTEIWLGDDEGHFVVKSTGTLKEGLLPGRYVVEFGLGTTTFPIDLTQDTRLTEEEIRSGPSCPRPIPQIPPLDEREWWHVVWWTHLAWPPTDARGDGIDLARLYSELADRHGGVGMSAPLPDRWQHKPEPEGTVVLSPFAREVVTRSIFELASSDRVAGETEIRALSVQERCVHLVLACPVEKLRQRIGRLKSRTATLLSFEASAGVGGKDTWGRGFWWAHLPSEELVRSVQSFVDQLP
jgi:hypothetical protein